MSTSAAAFHAIAASGLLSQLRRAAYTHLFEHNLQHGRAATAAELAASVPDTPGGRGLKGNMGARLCELVEWDVAEVVEERACTVTGHKAKAYRASGRWPTKPKRRPVKLSPASLRAVYRKTTDPASRAAMEHVARVFSVEL